MRTGRRRAEAGMTLLEVLIAMFLLALLAAGVFSAFVFSKRTEVAAGLRAQATQTAQAFADELRLATLRSSIPADDLTYTLIQNGTPYPLTLKAGPARAIDLHDPRWGDLLKPYHPTLTYTVENGAFDPDGTIWWNTDWQSPPQAITDATAQIKRVTWGMHHDDP